jgi:hypothetical protein
MVHKLVVICIRYDRLFVEIGEYTSNQGVNIEVLRGLLRVGVPRAHSFVGLEGSEST